jgi:cobalt-zinc-cadmium efflux system outer membrane protein
VKSLFTTTEPRQGRHLFLATLLAAAQVLAAASAGLAQTGGGEIAARAPATDGGGVPPVIPSPLARYVDQSAGMSADEAVAYALAHNGELAATRQEVEAARALVKQAALRANPKLDLSVSQNVTGPDNNITANGMLPLELGGRRTARIRVAERELEMRELALADRERLLAASVREKFGEALAETLKLGFDEELIAASQRGYRLVVARVTEGRTAPLEQNMVLVELNRLRSVREGEEGKVQVLLLELRNLVGMSPEEPLRLRGDFNDLIGTLPPLAEATEGALSVRPDLKLARTAESLAEARIEQARAEGRLDASLIAGYQRMNSGFPVNGINNAGQLQPVQDVFHYLTFGVSLDLPVRNKNQGAIEAAVAESEAARPRREFAELTVRREVAAAYAQYQAAARAAEIFRVGVRDQAGANLDVVRQTYELGAKSLIDYIGERRRFIELENGYIDALLDTYKARVEVERAVASPIMTKQETITNERSERPRAEGNR